jgi:hypothetical protein
VKDAKALLTSFIEVATFLFAAFGGFLTKIAPPDQSGVSYAVGIMSFLVLIVLMTLAAVGRKAPSKELHRRWMITGVVFFGFSLGASFLYPQILSQYTYPQHTDPKTRHISASDKYLTPDARQYKFANPDATAEDLDRNLPDGDIWTPAGIKHAESWLLAAYTFLVLSIAGAIFCLLEANLARNRANVAVRERPRSGASRR